MFSPGSKSGSPSELGADVRNSTPRFGPSLVPAPSDKYEVTPSVVTKAKLQCEIVAY